MHDKIWQINENGFFFAIGLLEGKNTILKDYLEMLTDSDKAEKQKRVIYLGMRKQ